ncbi:NAD(P)-binding domain-containing protein [Kribbella sp. NBC_00359]|uniref:NAD(P)-binding domain-containing protein n=1 Tax=Kribbella sp. NBC_00359 TaxID=2975966 RepID=UPI002E1FBF43
MTTIDTVVIGAGHAGLAVSRLLTGAGRDHVVVDRGRIGERWRSERWDSLRLLSPNWMTRLPHWEYDGSEPDGFMSSAGFVQHLERYAQSYDAPVLTGTTVRDLVTAHSGGYRLVTDRGTWSTRHVVIATGPHGVPNVPDGLDAAEVVTASSYRNPAQLPPGGVLVIGASSSGAQIADELNRAGREVYLAAGRHTRIPRCYRGRDIFCWLRSTGRLARTIDEVPDPVAARREPSMQLVGRRTGERARNLDLVSLQANGVRLLGRFEGMKGTRARFRPDLAATAADADVRMHRLLDVVDDYIACTGLTGEVLPAVRPPTLVAPAAARVVDLSRAGIATVLVATGYRPEYPWLRLPVIGPDGHIRQNRGVTAAPGVYVVGQRFQYRRDSAFIGGARHDAAAVVQHLLTGRIAGRTNGCSAEPAA